MVNSIKDLMTEADTISEISLMLGQKKDRICVVVEGEDDQKIFGHLLTENVDLFPSYAPKRGIERIVKDHFPKNKRVIGIRDRDYCSKKINSRIFFCDYCCAEMMMISIDSCFSRLYCNCYRGQATMEDLRLYCLEHLETFSKIRKMNETKKWMIRLAGINVNSLYDQNITNMDNAIVAEINHQNPNNQLNISRQNKCANLPKCTTLSNYLTITNGHDFVKMFAKMCPRGTSIDTITGILRGTFGQEEFKQTELYDSLKKYQSNKNVRIVY